MLHHAAAQTVALQKIRFYVGFLALVTAIGLALIVIGVLTSVASL